MTRFFSKKAWLTRIIILSYVLFGSGLSQALVWCQESSDFSHLEYIPAGSCYQTCFPQDDGRIVEDQTGDHFVFQAEADHCLDILLSFSHTFSSDANDITPLSVPDDSFFPHDFSDPAAIANLSYLNLLAQPPPSQSLVALRTIVLLI